MFSPDYFQPKIAYYAKLCHSTEHPMIISALNDLATTYCNEPNSWADSFLIIGFTALKATNHKGFSLATTMSTTIIHAPVGEKADALRLWANENKTLLEACMAKVLQVRFPSQERNISTITKIEIKRTLILCKMSAIG